MRRRNWTGRPLAVCCTRSLTSSVKARAGTPAIRTRSAGAVRGARRAGRPALRPPASVRRVRATGTASRAGRLSDEQAARVSGGWRIEHTEVPQSGERAPFEVDGQPFYLRGRIDRIDVHRDTGDRLIVDYKSSDSGHTPEQVHQRSGAWIDLQLPLYRHLAGVWVCPLP